MHRLIPAIAIILMAACGTAVAQDRQAKYQEQLAKGQEALRTSHFEDAAEAFRKAWSLSGKTSPDACLGLGIAFRGMGAHRDTVNACADGLKVSEDRPDVHAQLHNLRGTALAALADKPTDKKLQEAEEEFRQALAAQDSYVQARQNLGVVLLKMNRDEDGVRELKAYLETAPGARDADVVRRMIAQPRLARETLAPRFTVVTRDGQRISLDDLQGKTVVLDFWGSWCGPCVQALPGLVKLQKKLAEQPVVFLGIAQDEEAAWARFVEKNRMTWPQFLDANGALVRLFGVQGVPTYIVVDGEGVVRAKQSGYGPGTEAWLEREIKKTLKTEDKR